MELCGFNPRAASTSRRSQCRVAHPISPEVTLVPFTPLQLSGVQGWVRVGADSCLCAPRFRSAQEPRSGTMASIPSSGSLMATHNYRRRRLSSTSSTSSCSSEYSGEVIPHGPDLPKSDPGQWWASFFFGKTTHPAMTTVSESQESLGALRVAPGPMACALVAAPGRRRHVSESSAGPSV